MKMLKSDFTSAVQGTSVQQTLHPSMRVRALLQQTFTALSTLATVRLSLVMVMNMWLWAEVWQECCLIQQCHLLVMRSSMRLCTVLSSLVKHRKGHRITVDIVTISVLIIYFHRSKSTFASKLVHTLHMYDLNSNGSYYRLITGFVQYNCLCWWWAN